MTRYNKHFWWEIVVSQVLSKEIKKPKMQKVMRKIHEDLMLHGTGYSFIKYKEKRLLRRRGNDRRS